MTLTLNPYLSFRGTAREALEHYVRVFGGTLTLMPFGEMPGHASPEEAEWIMHGQIDGIAGGLTLMASDTPTSMDLTVGSDVTTALTGDDEETLRSWWDGLADGGTVTLPLEQAPWGDWYGQVTDRFGARWMVNITGSGQMSD
ncbi:VOC family protein [Sanguibacter sp. HDW7]|uniref:VOC family protein n=1 Tax=Sanguibacter sp. HDW7 TaxID=2714931 RepID=UPI00140793CA|nr:VOC family protein [Sanguibacter sp. HDW7]QIK83040.1 VOC family protein [Sanguibacter sp. HDW7]